jgi:5-dehydro-4-deoxyglucarate dehydratase
MMQPDELRGKLEGVIAFPITPFKKDYSVDLDAVRKNVTEMLKLPLCAIVAVGGTGEMYSLTAEEHNFEGLLEYYAAIGKATELGLFIYSRDWAAFSAGEVYRLAESIPNLIGWKDGQGDLRRYQAIMQRVGNRLHWIGGIGDVTTRSAFVRTRRASRPLRRGFRCNCTSGRRWSTTPACRG